MVVIATPEMHLGMCVSKDVAQQYRLHGRVALAWPT